MKRLDQMRSATPPTNLRIEPQTPGLHKLTWEDPAANQFRVSRRAANSPTWTLVADGVAGMQYLDHAIVEPGTVYRVDAIQQGAAPAGTEIVYTNPPQPQAAQQFRGWQDITEKVTLTWVVPPNVSGFRMFGPTLPPDGAIVNMRPESTPAGGYSVVYNLYNLPPGNHTFALASVYGDAGFVTAGMPTANVVTTARKARYRITVNGFRCNQATNDDPILHRDGKGDEVFVAVFVGSDLTEGRRVDRKIVRSQVYGDVNNFPGRIQAGSSSPYGGIGPGNAVPATAGAALSPVVPANDRLPLLVWEGELWDGDFGMAIAPTVWEWDGDTKNYDSWSGWLMGTRYDWLDVLKKELKPEPMRWYGIGPNLGADYLGITIDDSFGKDLPIGYSNVGMTSFTTSARPAFSSRAFLLNRGHLERLLGTNRTAVVAMNWTALGGVGGNYDVFLQFERL